MVSQRVIVNKKKSGSMMESVQMFDLSLVESQKLNRSSSQRHTELEEKKFHCEMAKELFDKDSGAPEDKAMEISLFLRKLFLSKGGGCIYLSAPSVSQSVDCGKTDYERVILLYYMKTHPPPCCEDPSESL